MAPEPNLDRRRALVVLDKIDEILAWEKTKDQERDVRFVELGQYRCEVRECQYWRLERLKSFDDFLEKRFPESRRKAYYLMAIHENLTKIPKERLRQIGWSKAVEMVKVARRDEDRFDCATWLHKAEQLPKEEFKRQVEQHLTGKDSEPWELIYFKVFKSQLPVIEQALETASLMLATVGAASIAVLAEIFRSITFAPAVYRAMMSRRISSHYVPYAISDSICEGLFKVSFCLHVALRICTHERGDVQATPARMVLTPQGPRRMVKSRNEPTIFLRNN